MKKRILVWLTDGLWIAAELVLCTLDWLAARNLIFGDTTPNPGNDEESGGAHTLTGKSPAAALEMVEAERDSFHRNSLRTLAFVLFGLLGFALLPSAVHAQGYAVTLNWHASASQCSEDCAEGTGPTLVNVYRAEVASGCTGADWSLLAMGQPAAGPYIDKTVLPGHQYCYEVKAYFVSQSSSDESGPSNWAHVGVPDIVPAVPTALTVIIET